MTTVIWWIRRDLRLQDNPALTHALTLSGQILPLYILDPQLLKKEAPFRRSFLFGALDSLDKSLRRLGSQLIVRAGEPLAELQKIFIEGKAMRIVAEADYSPYSKVRDRNISAALPCDFVPGLTIHPPHAVRKSDGRPYTVYSAFKRAWKSLPLPEKPLNAPERLPGLSSISSAAIPATTQSEFFPPSEGKAQKRLDTFFSSAIFSYRTNRDRMDMEGTSNISPYLKFGLISARNVYSMGISAIGQTESREDQANIEVWLDELIWREFYIGIMDSFPSVLEQAFRENLRRIEWSTSTQALEAWKNGLTGYPVVDAGMRQLRESGWMHNRARMITASFLTKDLLINWREGEKWFYERLVDGDLASNNGGWQWCAGTGTDAAPYFRIFNPVLQGRKFDPTGEYVRHWIPELAAVPNEFIHAPWEMPADLQSKTGVQIGKNYPAPIVDHAEARKRTLAAYQKSRSESEYLSHDR